jgi:sugar (pentulose or hexulose) kinase
MGDQLLLAINVGATPPKLPCFALVDVWKGSAAEYPEHDLRPGWVEQNSEDWWQAVCAATRQALERVPNASKRVAGVAVSAQAPTMVRLNPKKAGEAQKKISQQQVRKRANVILRATSVDSKGAFGHQ